jgi:hypothetical protein
MLIRADCIRQPNVLTPRDYTPNFSRPYKVRDNDTWSTCAARAQTDLQASIGTWELIRFNFPSLPQNKRDATLEVNWYLLNYIGCNKATADRKNLIFSSSANPGIIYLPKSLSAIEQKHTILTSLKERRESIMANTPGSFIIAEDSSIIEKPDPIYALKNYEEVTENIKIIEKYAIIYKLDADFLKAIVWMESTHGWYDRLYGDRNKTIRPMNIHAKLWEQLGITRNDLFNKEANISAGVHIISAIWERTEEPTYEKVATLYNQLGATKVNRYGKTVSYYRDTKPWLVSKPE